MVKDILAILLSAKQDEAAFHAAEILAQRFQGEVSATFLTALPDEPIAYEPAVVAGVWAELLGPRASGSRRRAHRDRGAAQAGW